MKEKTFSFNYGGAPFTEFGNGTTRKSGNVTVTEFIVADALKVTRHITEYPEYGAFEQVLYFENMTDKPTELISDLWDCDIDISLPGGIPNDFTAYRFPKNATKILSPRGSDWAHDEFYCNPDKVEDNHSSDIRISQTKEFKNKGGRSSQSKAPFFNVFTNDAGVIFAIGWSGQWNCSITRGEDYINIKTKIENAEFYLLPHEKIRTSSAVIMSYTGDTCDGSNKWRRLIKEHFSLIGTPGRPSDMPICAGIWGGMADRDILKRLDVIKKHKLPFEYIWMDAGWYGGENVGESPDEFEGDWGAHTGDWRVNTAHPGKLIDIAEKIHGMGLKFLLWFEPERVFHPVPMTENHPEYFLKINTDNGWERRNMLLNLGDENAWQYCFDMLSEHIENLGINCLRIDFNFNPLEWWSQNDTEQRRGITEIRYINGFYRLWDALLGKFPNLIIDNCASGGRRIDIETMRRSIPLWRSDMACPADYPSDYNQNHNTSFGTWMPYSGTGTGRDYDIYRVRSAYAGGLTTNYTYSARNSFGDDESKLEWLRKMIAEYKRVRPYFYADLYPLTKISDNDDIWYAAQYNRPENGDGILQVFRREKACGTAACYKLRGLDISKNYEFEDADGGEKVIISGKELSECGFEVKIGTPRTAKIFFYKTV